MVARMVRDHKVVGSNPVTSTKNAEGEDAPAAFLIQERRYGIRGEAKERSESRSAETTAGLTALGLGCQPCAVPKRRIPSPRPKTDTAENRAVSVFCLEKEEEVAMPYALNTGRVPAYAECGAKCCRKSSALRDNFCALSSIFRQPVWVFKICAIN